MKPRWVSALLIGLAVAAPFVAVSIWLDFLRVQINAANGTDETIFHLGVIRQFAQQWPWPDLRDYGSATTPLFHLVFAAAMQGAGLELPGLRALNVVLSIGVVCLLHRLFRRRLGLPSRDALLATAAFGVSPYFFGASFLVLTDNLAWGLAVASIDRLMLATSRRRRLDWVLASCLLALAMLTRQNYVWLCGLALGLAACSPGTVYERLQRMLISGASALPLLPLVLTWGGLVPPTFQAGGASGIEHRPGVDLNLTAVVYALSVLGFYSLFLPLADPARGERSRTRWIVWIAVLAVAAALLLIHPVRRGPEYHVGLLWNLSERVPVVLDSSLLFWGLLPLGLGALWRRLRADLVAPSSVGLVSIVLLSMVSSAYVFQKYFDPAVPLLLALSGPRDAALSRPARVGYALLFCLGVVYFLFQARLTAMP